MTIFILYKRFPIYQLCPLFVLILSLSFDFSVITELLSNIQCQVSCLYDLSDIVAMVDMLLSLAHTATISSYSKYQ